MKKYIVLIFIVISTVGLNFAQEWQTNFEKAKKIATQNQKPIVLVFQGSDWCTPCIKLDRDVWSTEEFKTYAKNNFVLLQADFPRRKKNALTEFQQKANADLAEKYNTRGIFPLVVVLDNNGKVLGQTGYKKTTVKAYIEELNAFVK